MKSSILLIFKIIFSGASIDPPPISVSRTIIIECTIIIVSPCAHNPHAPAFRYDPRDRPAVATRSLPPPREILTGILILLSFSAADLETTASATGGVPTTVIVSSSSSSSNTLPDLPPVATDYQHRHHQQQQQHLHHQSQPQHHHQRQLHLKEEDQDDDGAAMHAASAAHLSAAAAAAAVAVNGYDNMIAGYTYCNGGYDPYYSQTFAPLPPYNGKSVAIFFLTPKTTPRSGVIIFSGVVRTAKFLVFFFFNGEEILTIGFPKIRQSGDLLGPERSVGYFRPRRLAISQTVATVNFNIIPTDDYLWMNNNNCNISVFFEYKPLITARVYIFCFS